MIIETILGVDVWNDPNADETFYFYHIPPVNNMTVTVAYSVNDDPLLPFDYENESLDVKLEQSNLGDGTFRHITLDTETGDATLFDRHSIEKQELTILPYALDLINENLKAEPNGLAEWND